MTYFTLYFPRVQPADSLTGLAMHGGRKEAE
ncbi:hypothetical protein BV96_01081 [Sphingomonas paucimobilis]|nr:hypothetical protein BV96_01081 [Sphingomonas paucimobilis]